MVGTHALRNSGTSRIHNDGVIDAEVCEIWFNRHGDLFVLRARERGDPGRGTDGIAERQCRSVDGVVSANDLFGGR
jgi:hypothetical protein